MTGGEGELVQTPYGDLPMTQWPWDFYMIVNLCRYRQGVAREIAMKEDFPPPTERTQKNGRGMKKWKEWVQAQEEKRMKQASEESDPKKRKPLDWETMYTMTHLPVWDHINGLMYAHRKTAVLMTTAEFEQSKANYDRRNWRKRKSNKGA